MRLVFFETPVFTRLLPEYLNDEEFRTLQYALMQNPALGPVMAGTGGFRKLRWRDIRRGKGRRGGMRIIYYWMEAESQIWLFTLYTKGEMEDLSAKQCRLLKSAIHDELQSRRENR